MASAQTTTQLLESMTPEMMKNVVTPQFQLRAMLWNKIMKGEGQDVNSRGCRIPLYVTPGAGNTFTNEGGVLPSPVAEENIAARVKFVQFRFSLSATWTALQEMRKKGTLGKGLQGLLTRRFNAAYKFLNRLLYGSGDGCIAIPTGVSSLVVTFANSTAGGWTFGSAHILRGEAYQFFDATNTQIVGGGVTSSVVTAVSASGHTATFDALPSDLAAAIAAGTVRMVVKGSINGAPRGFAHHFSNGNETWQTVPRDLYPETRAVIVEADGDSITIVLFLRINQETKFRVEQEDETGERAYICNPAQIIEYELLGHGIKRADVKETKLDLGFTEHTYNGNKFWEDVDAPYDKWFIYYSAAFEKYQYREMDMINEGSGVWRDVREASTGNHTEKAIAFGGGDFELGCVRPGLLGAITELAYTEIGMAA